MSALQQLRIPFLILPMMIIWGLSACISPTDSGTHKQVKASPSSSSTMRTTSSSAAQDTLKKKKRKSKKEETTPIEIDPERLVEARRMINELSDTDLSVLDSPSLFKKNCAICHGRKGNMKINGAKDLTKSQATLEESVAQIYFGQGLMTPFKGVMEEDEIVATAKYIMTLRE